MAPLANIDLVEASTSQPLDDLMLAARTAATLLDASVVSMSFGESVNYPATASGAILGQYVSRDRPRRQP